LGNPLKKQLPFIHRGTYETTFTPYIANMQKIFLEKSLVCLCMAQIELILTNFEQFDAF